MSVRHFDSLGTARDLEAAGLERVHAGAIACAIGRTHERAATSADLAPLATKAERSALETRVTNRFYGIAIALAGVVIASANIF